MIPSICEGVDLKALKKSTIDKINESFDDPASKPEDFVNITDLVIRPDDSNDKAKEKIEQYRKLSYEDQMAVDQHCIDLYDSSMEGMFRKVCKPPSLNFDNINESISSNADDNIDPVDPSDSADDIEDYLEELEDKPNWVKRREEERMIKDYGVRPKDLKKMAKERADDLRFESAKILNSCLENANLPGRIAIMYSLAHGSNMDQSRMDESWVLPEAYNAREYVNSEVPMLLPEEMDDLVDEDSKLDRDIIKWYEENIYKNLDVLNSGEIVEYHKYSFKDFRNDYKAMLNGVQTEDFINFLPKRTKILEHLMMTPDKYRDEIISLGWNPMVEFSMTNRSKSRDKICNLLQEKYDNELIDLSDFIELCNEDTTLNESMFSKDNKYPVFVVFSNRDTIIHKTIRFFTKGNYGHAAISFDHDLKNLYTFSGTGHGFTVEHFREYLNARYITVVAFFVNKDSYDKMKNTVVNFNKIKKKTSYNFRNLIDILMKKKNESSVSMVCSGFVDYIMKVGGYSATKISYSNVHPNRLFRSMVRSRKRRFYKIYKGPAKDYNPKKMLVYLDRIKKGIVNEDKDFDVDNIGKEVKELFDKMVAPYIDMQVINEEEKLPIEFDNNGDLLIHKRKVDYAAEYSKSHKLLMSYDEVDNYDGMKVELCKLWWMNGKLEALIHRGKDVDKNTKTRAHILNDFNKYLKKVMINDKKFNFSEYYSKSPYGNEDTVRVKKSTLKYTTAMIKKLLTI